MGVGSGLLMPRPEGHLRALWRIRLRTAVPLALPILIMALWFGWRATSTHLALAHLAGEEVSLTVESFQLHLHDQLRRDLRRLLLPEPPEQAEIPVFSLMFIRSDLQMLSEHISAGGQRRYVPVLVSKDGGRYRPARVRLRGTQHWHWAHPQKSMRIVMADGTYLEGESTFNLINEVAPIGVGEDVIYDVLDDLGVLTPRYRPVRVEINNRNMGVYFHATQPDESLIRRHRRAYGSLYSGNGAAVDPGTGRSTLWWDAGEWKRVARSATDEDEDKREIERLLEMVTGASDARFAAFARDELDLGQFAAFDAVDVVFGGSQHDWDQNHKLYVDPYTGRFEPVAWNFRGWRHEPTFQISENPLRLRLARVPGYLATRNRIIYELLTGPCSVHEIRQRLLRKVRRSAGEYESDPYWDAYKLLPRVNRGMRRLVRPMDEERQAMVLESEVKTFADRHAFLTKALERSDIRVGLGDPVPIPGGSRVTPLEVIVGGHGGYHLEDVQVDRWEGGGRPTWRLFRDADMDGAFDPDVDSPVTEPFAGPGAAPTATESLYPAALTTPRANPTPTRGPVSLTPAPRRYRFFILAEGTPESVTLDLRSAVTGWRLAAAAAGTEDPADVAPIGDGGTVPAFEAGETGCHPWFLTRPSREPVRIGPGPVEFDGSRIFGEDEPVTILPGTEIRLAGGASLVFRALVKAQGTPDAPITITPLDPARPFGGIALQGGGTAGSILTHVRISGGTVPAWGWVRYPAMLNIHGTREIRLEDCVIRGNPESSDILHVAYGRGVTLKDCRFADANLDAVDLEFTEAEILSTQIIRSGDEGVDLQSSDVRIVDSIILGADGSGISAGERSRVEISGTLIARSDIGVLVKSRSEASLRGSLLFDDRVGLRNETRSPKYGGRSRLLGDILHAVRCGVSIETDGGPEPDLLRVVEHLPQDGSLSHLRRDVLGLDGWSGLEPMVRRLAGGAEEEGR